MSLSSEGGGKKSGTGSEQTRTYVWLDSEGAKDVSSFGYPLWGIERMEGKDDMLVDHLIYAPSFLLHRMADWNATELIKRQEHYGKC